MDDAGLRELLRNATPLPWSEWTSRPKQDAALSQHAVNELPRLLAVSEAAKALMAASIELGVEGEELRAAGEEPNTNSYIAFGDGEYVFCHAKAARRRTGHTKNCPWEALAAALDSHKEKRT